MSDTAVLAALARPESTLQHHHTAGHHSSSSYPESSYHHSSRQLASLDGSGRARGRGRTRMARSRGDGNRNPSSNKPQTDESSRADGLGNSNPQHVAVAVVASSSSHEPSTSSCPVSISATKPRNRNRNRNKKENTKNQGEPLQSNGTESKPDATSNSAVDKTNPKPGGNSRRQQFGGKLTETKPDAESSGPATHGQKAKKPSNAGRSNRNAKAKAADVVEPVEYADLRSRLLAELSSGQYDCVVCYSTVTTKQAVWSCSQCYNVLHLGCVKKWAETSVKKVEEQNAMQEDPEIRNRKGTWRCPGCQYAREDGPRAYWCWCGSTLEPTGNRGTTPHGCGQRCSRGTCSHGCADQCHPGPCPSCAVTVSQKCYCGAQTIPIRCSQTLAKTSSLSALGEHGNRCGNVCGKKLNCGVHKCDQACHPGECLGCQVRLKGRCYCGKHTQSMSCGQGSPKMSTSIDGQTWTGLFSCHDRCDRPFDCGIHRCQKPCHPLDRAEKPCPSSTQLIKTCPCGATPCVDRTSCEDPIPECNNLCAKPFPCGHSCPSKCHLGPCPACRVSVSTPCRCGETKSARPCFERQREESEGNQEVLCKTACQALRHCGKHQCGRQCCPLYFQAKTKSKKRPAPAELQALDPGGFHECSVPCSKPLPCGKHQCPLTCHRGPCLRCLQASFEELECHCGRTVMEPPVPCGAQVVCNFLCVRSPPICGHPKNPHNCHEEEACPPCVYLTDKVCHCEKNIVKNVPCSRSRISCGQACDALLNCGFHRCQGVCHKASLDECAPCNQVCGKPRKLCQHACQEKCHAPSSCSEKQPCEAVITLQCPCGNLQSRVKCNVSVHNPTKEKSLKCNNSCAIAQRNARIAEALGLNPNEKAASASYEQETLTFYASPANRKFCEEVEMSLNDFIRSPRAGLILPPANNLQRKFTHELAAVYRLSSESLDSEPRRSVSIRRKQDSRIPSPLISETFAAARVSLASAQAGQGRTTGLSQLRRPGNEPPKPLNAVFLPGVFGHDQDSLRVLLQPVLKTIHFQVHWKGDEDVVITSAESPTRLIMMKTELKALVRRERFAKDVILCAIDNTNKILRREDEPMLGVPSGNGGAAAISGRNPPSSSVSAWGATGFKAGTGTVSTGTRTGGSTSNAKGWAAVASGSGGQASPIGTNGTANHTTNDSSWGVVSGTVEDSDSNATNGYKVTAARVIPNPNAPPPPHRLAERPLEPAAVVANLNDSSPIPDSWDE